MTSTLRPNAPRLAIVVPCYNEADVYAECLQQLGGLLRKMEQGQLIAKKSFLLFVDDGSQDTTWQQIEESISEHDFVQGVKLSRNVGHQSALLAGLKYAEKEADAIVSIDADLQDDIAAIPKMLMAYSQGHDVVYGVRSCRQTDSWFKRTTAEGFYRFMDLMGVKQVANHADFRLLSRRALQALLEYRENNAYLRGLVPLVGFPATEVHYARGARLVGESKYPLRKMMALAMEGITSMTISPLRFISFLGFLFRYFLFFLQYMYSHLKLQAMRMRGWPSVMLAIFFMGGIQMLSLGIIGEYIGKIYLEVKMRPRSHLEKYVRNNSCWLYWCF